MEYQEQQSIVFAVILTQSTSIAFSTTYPHFMSNLWNFFKNLLPKAEASSPSQPLIHEMIERSEEEKQDYQQWKQTLVLRRLLDWIKDQFAIYQVAPQDIDEGIDFLDTPSSKGFVVHFNQTRYSRRDATHFMDYLKETVLRQHYRTQISDTRSYNRANWVETIERHYLKPGLKIQTTPAASGKFTQKYGNIMIELELRNDQVYNLRFRATSYKDRQFQQAADFGELMQLIMA
jgi:hypothetical protein